MANEWHIEKASDEIRRAAYRGIIRATEEVLGEVKRLILDTPKTGRVYKRGAITHQASGKNEPPASDTGRLIRLISSKYDLPTLTGKVISSASYSAYLEYGTAKMAQRPFMRPALAAKRKIAERYVAEEIKAVTGS